VEVLNRPSALLRAGVPSPLLGLWSVPPEHDVLADNEPSHYTFPFDGRELLAGCRFILVRFFKEFVESDYPGVLHDLWRWCWYPSECGGAIGRYLGS
jgi:hypothetical protein